MVEKEYAYVIQRDDGRFCRISSIITRIWFLELSKATLFTNLKEVKAYIKQERLDNCKPVKIKIRVVEDETNSDK